MQSITLQTSDSSVAESGVLGRLGFAASSESDGADSILVAAIIEAVAEGNFTQTSNATSLVFSTASSSTASEKMRITSTGNVGIGMVSPSYKLDVNGTFSANSINVNDQFTFPTTDGSANQVLVTDGSGVFSWQNQTGSTTSTSSYAMIHVFG